MSEAKEKVLAFHKEAWQSDSGRVWTSESGFVAAGRVRGMHATKTRYYLGDDWEDAAANLRSATRTAISEDA